MYYYCLWYDKLWGPSQRVVTLFDSQPYLPEIHPIPPVSINPHKRIFPKSQAVPLSFENAPSMSRFLCELDFCEDKLNIDSSCKGAPTVRVGILLQLQNQSTSY